MVNGLSDHIKFDVRGTIKTGYKTVKANCPACKKTVKAIKPENDFICPECGAITTAIPGEKEGMESSPYFVLPQEVKAVMGDKVSSLSIVPAYREIKKTFPTSYTKYAANIMIYCTGDGEKALRYDKGAKGKIEVPCSEECSYRKDNTCKLTATFYLILPDIDVLNAYKIIPKSPQSIYNIMSTLNKLKGPDELIARPICNLKITPRKRKGTGTTYYLLELLPPVVPLNSIGMLMNGSDPLVLTGNSKPGQTFQKAPVHGNGQRGNSSDDQELLQTGRARVKREAREYVVGPFAEQAVEKYACERFGVESYEDLTVDELRQVWDDLGPNSEAVNQIYELAVSLRQQNSSPLFK